MSRYLDESFWIDPSDDDGPKPSADFIERVNGNTQIAWIRRTEESASSFIASITYGEERTMRFVGLTRDEVQVQVEQIMARSDPFADAEIKADQRAPNVLRPKWSDRDLWVMKNRFNDQRATWNSQLSQVGQAMGLPQGSNFMACIERAKELQPDEVPARAEPNFLVDDRGYVSFWADGDDSPCAELDLLLEGDGEDPEFSLLDGGDMHDGFSSISAIAEHWPRVSDSLEGWKRGETFAFSELLQAAKDARKDLEANNT